MIGIVISVIIRILVEGGNVIGVTIRGIRHVGLIIPVRCRAIGIGRNSRPIVVLWLGGRWL